MFIIKKILFSWPLDSRFLLPAPQTKNTRSMYAVEAGADNRFLCQGSQQTLLHPIYSPGARFTKDLKIYLKIVLSSS